MGIVPKVPSEIQMNNFSPIHISVFSQSKLSELDQQGKPQMAKETATIKNYARATIVGPLVNQVQDVQTISKQLTCQVIKRIANKRASQKNQRKAGRETT